MGGPISKQKIATTELDIATKQAEKMLRDMYRVQATQNKSADQKENRSSVDLWKDTDFFFSIVFQSSAQKYTFLEAFSKKFGLGIDNAKSNNEIIQVVNGLKLAKNLDIKIPSEKKTRLCLC